MSACSRSAETANVSVVEMFQPKLVLIFSGKRKSGKDFLTDELLRILPVNSAVIIRLSGPLKEAYAVEHELDFKRLLDASEYKEKYRADMVSWGELKRRQDPGFFCRLAIEKYKAHNFPVWIISDARRQTDLDFFAANYPEQSRTCRVVTTDEVRSTRGWAFSKGIDDAETECGLDNVKKWDFVLNNDGIRSAQDLISPCVDLATTKCGVF